MATKQDQLKEEIARLINHGLDNQEIADIIFTPHYPGVQPLIVGIARDYITHQKPVA